MVSRLQAKTLQIGQMLNNLQKFNHLLNDDHVNSRNVDNKASFSRLNKNQIKSKPNSFVFKEIPKPTTNPAKKEESPKSLENENPDQEKPQCDVEAEIVEDPQQSDASDSRSNENNENKSRQQNPIEDKQVVMETSYPTDSNKTEL